MNKILLSLISFLFIFTSVFAYSKTDLEKVIIKGYIVSDDYDDESKCNDDREKFNKEFLDYDRTECFNVGEKFNYLIVNKGESTNLIDIFGSDSFNINKNLNSISNDLKDVFSDYGINPISETLFEDINEKIISDLGNFSVDELSDFKDFIENNPNLSDEEKEKLLSEIDEELSRVNISIDGILNEFNLNSESKDFVKDLEKLIESGKLNGLEEDELIKYINNLKNLSEDEKDDLLALFVNCSESEKKVAKINNSGDKEFLCISKTTRTCFYKVNYLPYSMGGGNLKFYDDRFFEKKTGLYYWQCLDDSRFKKVKPLVCFNGYKKVGNKCVEMKTEDFRVAKCKIQCATVLDGKYKIYYNNATPDYCECVYFKDSENKLKPQYVRGGTWDYKNNIRRK